MPAHKERMAELELGDSAVYFVFPTRKANHARNADTVRNVIELSLAGTVSQNTVALFVRLSMHRRL